MLNLAGVKKLPKLMAIIVKELPSIVPCDGVGIFITQPQLILSKALISQGLQLQKSMLEGRAFDVIN